MLESMEERVLNKSGLAVFILGFFIAACTHSPINPEVTNKSGSNKTFLTDTTQQPEFIIPPLDDSYPHSGKESDNTKDRLIWDHIGDNLELTRFYTHPHVLKQKEKVLK